MSLLNNNNNNNNNNNEEINNYLKKKNKKPLEEYIKSNSSNILIDYPLDEHYNLDKINSYNNEDIELENLEKEFTIKSKSSIYGNTVLNSHINFHPKNYGNIWIDEQREKIFKYLKKNNYENNLVLFDESVIFDIAHKLERTEHGVKEEIKKMIFNEFMDGSNVEKISKKFYIPVQNIKLLLKLFIEKNGKKIINSIGTENQLLKLKIENIKLKKELTEIISCEN